MNRKRIGRKAAAVLLMFGLSGCAQNQIPELTQDEIQTVSEYVAVTMMKYDAGHRSRLVELPEGERLPPVETPVPTAVPQAPPVASEQQTSPDDNTQQTPSEEAVNPYSMEEVMGLPEGVAAAYTGYQLCSRYPDNGGAGGFSLDAVDGRQLLILKFSLTNTSGQEQAVDLLSSGTVYRITVNGNYIRRALTTILGDDMTTFVGTLPEGSSTEAVLVIEVENETADNLSSLEISLKNDSKTYTLQLF